MCLAALQRTAPPADALLAEHRLLRDAFLAGDGPRLATVLEEHMADAVDRIVGADEQVATAPGAPEPGLPTAG
jgi:DNA-binding GntR family transcriptional regulator